MDCSRCGSEPHKESGHLISSLSPRCIADCGLGRGNTVVAAIFVSSSIKRIFDSGREASKVKIDRIGGSLHFHGIHRFKRAY